MRRRTAPSSTRCCGPRPRTTRLARSSTSDSAGRTTIFGTDSSARRLDAGRCHIVGRSWFERWPRPWPGSTSKCPTSSWSGPWVPDERRPRGASDRPRSSTGRPSAGSRLRDRGRRTRGASPLRQPRIRRRSARRVGSDRGQPNAEIGMGRQECAGRAKPVAEGFVLAAPVTLGRHEHPERQWITISRRRRPSRDPPAQRTDLLHGASRLTFLPREGLGSTSHEDR